MRPRRHRGVLRWAVLRDLKRALATSLDALSSIRPITITNIPSATEPGATEAGFDAQHAAGIARYALWSGITLVMGEPGAEWLSLEERAQGQRKKQIIFAPLPSDTYPQLVECAVAMTANDDPGFHYGLGVSLFIAGVEAIAARQTTGE